MEKINFNFMKTETQLEIEKEVARQLKAEKLRLAKMIQDKLGYYGHSNSSPNIIAVIREWANS